MKTKLSPRNFSPTPQKVTTGRADIIGLASDKPREACGIVAVCGHPEAAKLVYLGLYALQHRGQESAGIATIHEGRLHVRKAAGLVADVFTADSFRQLPGTLAIGHVRYSTTGSSREENAQPIVANYRGGSIAVAHNGNITNAATIREELEQRGAIFQSSTDTEVLIHLVAQAAASDFQEALFMSLLRLRGAYSMLVLHSHELVAVKDPRGFRPLCFGKLGDAYVIASESCALDIMNAEYLRELAPGEMLVYKNGELRASRPFPPTDGAFCVFEYIYFSRPDSLALGHAIYEYRERLGAQLADEQPAEADVVIAVPDSSIPAAIGYARRSGMPYAMGLIRSHYVGRTFIEPSQAIRDFGARIKYNAVRSVLEGKRVVVVDDSIVRGTTSRKIANIIRAAGAREIHVRISAPPWRNPCFFGIDTPKRERLIAATAGDVESIRKFIGCDSLGFLSLEGLLRVVPRTQQYCTACFTGHYPPGQAPQGEFEKDILED
ncbi:MAG: amidophosphoribosyltransferase [Candidatus Sumerlaeaceae bacterium]